MHVRLATIDDLPAVLAISNRAAEHTPANFAIEPEPLAEWESDFRETGARFAWLVAVDDDEGGSVAGFAKAGPWKGRCAYAYTAEVTVYVDPRRHGRGIGRALYDRLIGICAAQGYRTLLAGITVPNEASVGLHESFGFRRVAMLERVGWKFDRWHDVGYWELILGDGDEPPRAIRPVADVVGSLA